MLPVNADTYDKPDAHMMLEGRTTPPKGKIILEVKV